MREEDSRTGHFDFVYPVGGRKADLIQIFILVMCYRAVEILLLASAKTSCFGLD